MSKLYSLQEFEQALLVEIQINNLTNKLKRPEYQPFWDEEKGKYITYAEYVVDLEEQKKQTLFDIKESTGEGNYSNPENWTINEIADYLNRKSAQIKKTNAQYGRKD